MKIRPITFRKACVFVDRHHRHHHRPQGGVFCLACLDGETIVGVAIVGRPVSRMLDDGLTAEVTRLCTDGTKNAASKLYAAARRVAGAMGYEKVVTYILDTEPGTSLRAAGWTLDGDSAGGSWSREKRKRDDTHPTGTKQRWLAL